MARALIGRVITSNMEKNKYMRGEEGAPDGGPRRKAVGEERTEKEREEAER